MVCPSRFDGLGSTTMRVEVLYFDGCPTYRTAEKTLRAVLAQGGAEAVVELVAVNTDEEAQKLRFPGSPTIRVEAEYCSPHQTGRSTRSVAGTALYWCLRKGRDLPPEGFECDIAERIRSYRPNRPSLRMLPKGGTGGRL